MSHSSSQQTQLMLVRSMRTIIKGNLFAIMRLGWLRPSSLLLRVRLLSDNGLRLTYAGMTAWSQGSSAQRSFAKAQASHGADCLFERQRCSRRNRLNSGLAAAG
jgi:hypothetical protein